MHQIDSLRHLHVRLQAGPSLYETPPALPFSSAPASTSLVSAAPPLHDAAPPSPPPAAIVMPSTASSGFYVNVTSTSSPPPPVLKSASRSKSANKSSVSKEPPTLSGFKDLQTLAVLDIDTLDVVTELKSCVRNSAGTLHKLKLSFSDALGRQARKPPPAIDPDDSDQDDDFQVVPLPASSSFNDDASEPAKVFRAQEERKNQESVLGRIFDVEPYVVRKSSRKTSEKKKEAKEPSSTDPGEDFIAAIKDISTKLVNSVNGNSNPSQAQQEILDTIAKAATLYVAANAEAKQSSGKKGAKKGKKGKDEEPDSDAGSRSSSNPTPVEESKAEDQSIDDSAGSATELFADKAVKRRDSQTDLSPDDIDIEEPEEQLVIDHQEPTATELAILKELAILQSQTLGTPEPWPSKVESAPGKSTSASTPSVDKAMANLAVQRDNFMILVEKLEACELRANRLKKEIKQLRSDNSPGALQRLLEAEKQMISSVHTIESLRSELNTVDAEIDDAEKQIPPAEGADVDEVGKQRVTDYLRTTRGMAVRSLHIYLIPVKASVLSRALDLRVLERLTLLNVGTQAPIWTLLHKENAESPLPLRKIFTDNVSQPFLNFVSQLPALHDFFILERMEKYKPESFAPKTTMTIDHIRRLVFKKHMATLKRVMVKNQNDTSWDFDERTVALVCRRGRQLEELACSMGIKTIVRDTTHASPSFRAFAREHAS